MSQPQAGFYITTAGSLFVFTGEGAESFGFFSSSMHEVYVIDELIPPVPDTFHLPKEMME